MKKFAKIEKRFFFKGEKINLLSTIYRLDQSHFRLGALLFLVKTGNRRKSIFINSRINMFQFKSMNKDNSKLSAPRYRLMKQKFAVNGYEEIIEFNFLFVCDRKVAVVHYSESPCSKKTLEKRKAYKRIINILLKRGGKVKTKCFLI